MNTPDNHRDPLNQTLDQTLKQTLRQAFSPAMPIHHASAFYGRHEELERLSEAIDEPGMHIMLYGERGIGKTSLANVVFARDPNLHFIKVTCSEKQGFTNLWRQILTRLQTDLTPDMFQTPTRATHSSLKQKRPSSSKSSSAQATTAHRQFQSHIASLLDKTQRNALSTEELLKSLNSITQPLVIVLDEFDLAAKQKTLSHLFANLIKTFSDRLPHITLLLVGIANSGTELIEEHPSLERCLSQIMLRRMHVEEMSDLLEGCLLKVNLTIHEEVKTLLIALSSGFPYYVHMLGKYAAESALLHRYTVITKTNLKVSVQKAVRHTFESIVSAYQKANRPSPTLPPRAATLHNALIEAAAQFKPHYDLLHTPDESYSDDEISFSAKDLLPSVAIKAAAFEDQASQYSKKASLALSQLTRPTRGSVLRKVPKISSSDPSQYRFQNPLLKAFVLLKLYLQ